MRRLCRSAAALVPIVLLALALLPTLAHAADSGQSSYAGTYMGLGDGKDKNGKTGDSMVTIWVEDLGDSARITFQIDKLDVTVNAEGPEQWDGEDLLTVPVGIDQLGVTASGEITFTREGDTWTLGGVGNGKASKYEGDGQTAMSRISTGIQLPSLGQQIKDMGSEIADGPPGATNDSVPPPEGQAETQAEEASSLALAEAAPPFSTERLVFGLAMIVLFIFLMFLF